MDIAIISQLFEPSHVSQWKRLIFLKMRIYNGAEFNQWKYIVFYLNVRVDDIWFAFTDFGFKMYLREKSLNSPGNIKKLRNSTLEVAVRYDMVGRARIVIDYFKITKKGLGAQLLRLCKMAAEYNNLDMLMYFTERLQIRKSDISGDCCSILATSVKVIISLRNFRWLVDTFEFNSEEILSNERVMVKLAKRKDTSTIQWLIDRFNWRKDEVVYFVQLIGYRSIVHYAAQFGHFDLLKMLIGRLGFCRADAIWSGCNILRLAAGNGHLQIAQWLVEKYDIEKHELDLSYYDMINILHSKHWPTFSWLIDRFGLTRNDIPDIFPGIFYDAIEDNTVALLWLIDHFEIREDELTNIFKFVVIEENVRALKIITRECAINRQRIMDMYVMGNVSLNTYHPNASRWLRKHFNFRNN